MIAMTLILGIDPGSRKTGFGLINVVGSRHEYVASGVIHLTAEQQLAGRLKLLFDKLNDIILLHAPQRAAVEQVFMAKNAAAALKLGQARGVAIVACVVHNVVVDEYSAKQIKQSVVGVGAASKQQVQYMVKALLTLSDLPQEDEADALAAAICDAHTQASLLHQVTL